MDRTNRTSLAVGALVLSILLGVALPAQGANQWTGEGDTNLWTDPANWSEGVPPPDATSHPNFGWDDPTGVFYPLTPDTSDDFPLFVNEAQLTNQGTTTLIDDSVTAAEAYGLYVGFDGATNELEMTGGSLKVGEWHINVGRGFNRTDNPDPVATFRMSGGAIETGIVKVPEQFVDRSQQDPYDSAPLHGEFFMSGGVLNARKLNVGQLTGSGEAWFSGDAVVNLVPNVPGDPGNGGFLEMKQDWFVDGLPVPTVADAHIDISGGAIINISGHMNRTLTVPDAAEVTRYQSYVDAGWLTAWQGAAEPVIALVDQVITISAPAIPGDYNADGITSALDYAVWRDNLGVETTLPSQNPTAQTPNLVDQEDYDYWKTHFGATPEGLTSSTGQSVPEPTGVGLWVCFCALFLAFYRKPCACLEQWQASRCANQFARIASIAFVAPMFAWCSQACGQGGNIWEGGSSNNLWTDSANWSMEFVSPNATSHPYVGWDDPNGEFYPLTEDTSDDLPPGINDVKLARNGTMTLVDNSVSSATAYGVRVGNGGATNTLQVTGGRLDIGIDPNAPPTQNAVGWHLQVGRGYPGFDNGPINQNPMATVLMSGGTINTNGLLIPEQFVDHSLADPTDSAPLNGELIMSGGVINARWMNLGQLKGNGRAVLSGEAEINLASNVPGNPANGGHLEFNRDWFLDGLPVPSSGEVNLDISQNAVINIFGHQSSVAQTPNMGELQRYEAYVDDHWLTAWDGTAAPIITLHTAGDAMISIEAPTVPGDYSNDGVTNAVDYAVWRESLNNELTLNGEDPNAATPGFVDQEDYDYWKTNFGVTASDISPLPPLSLVQSVPEANAICLLILGSALVAGNARPPACRLRR